MTIWSIVVIVIAAAIVVAAVVAMVRSRRRAGLRKQFGPEYDRAVESSGSRRQAEVDLRDRLSRHQQLDIRPLAPETQERYTEEWRRVQAEFVDAPTMALAEADALVTRVMKDRGYPMQDFESQAALVSVDHGGVVDNYRDGHRTFVAAQQGQASTEDMRRGFVYYRALFAELLDGQREATR